MLDLARTVLSVWAGMLTVALYGDGRLSHSNAGSGDVGQTRLLQCILHGAAFKDSPETSPGSKCNHQCPEGFNNFSFKPPSLASTAFPGQTWSADLNLGLWSGQPQEREKERLYCAGSTFLELPSSNTAMSSHTSGFLEGVKDSPVSSGLPGVIFLPLFSR